MNTKHMVGDADQTLLDAFAAMRRLPVGLDKTDAVLDAIAQGKDPETVLEPLKRKSRVGSRVAMQQELVDLLFELEKELSEEDYGWLDDVLHKRLWWNASAPSLRDQLRIAKLIAGGVSVSELQHLWGIFVRARRFHYWARGASVQTLVSLIGGVPAEDLRSWCRLGVSLADIKKLRKHGITDPRVYGGDVAKCAGDLSSLRTEWRRDEFLEELADREWPTATLSEQDLEILDDLLDEMVETKAFQGPFGGWGHRLLSAIHGELEAGRVEALRRSIRRGVVDLVVHTACGGDRRRARRWLTAIEVNGWECTFSLAETIEKGITPQEWQILEALPKNRMATWEYANLQGAERRQAFALAERGISYASVQLVTNVASEMGLTVKTEEIEEFVLLTSEGPFADQMLINWPAGMEIAEMIGYLRAGYGPRDAKLARKLGLTLEQLPKS